MIRVLRYRPFSKNTLRGFVDLEPVRTGFVIRDCCWHVEFTSGAPREQFQRQALAAIRAFIGEQAA